MCIQSPIIAFIPSPLLCGCHTPCSGSDSSFLGIHIHNAMGSLLIILGLWMNSDSSSHVVPSAVTGSSLYLDSDTLLWTIETTVLFPAIDFTLLYLTTVFKLKYQKRKTPIQFFWLVIKSLWAFERRKCSASIRKKGAEDRILILKEYSG